MPQTFPQWRTPHSAPSHPGESGVDDDFPQTRVPSGESGMDDDFPAAIQGGATSDWRLAGGGWLAGEPGPQVYLRSSSTEASPLR
jgi:hypothetical protein